MLMQPNKQPDYDFIMNHPGAPRKSMLSGNSTKQRALIVAVGVLILIILAVVVSNVLSSAGKVQKQRLFELAQTQTEIIRLTSVADSKATTQTTRTLAATTRLTVESSRQEVLSALSARGMKKIKDKELALGRNTKSDTLLNEAIPNNRFDETYKSLLQTQLTDYQKLLNQVYDSGSAKEKKAVNAARNSNALIAKSYASAQ
jgi:hypothetical protein